MYSVVPRIESFGPWLFGTHNESATLRHGEQVEGGSGDGRKERWEMAKESNQTFSLYDLAQLFISFRISIYVFCDYGQLMRQKPEN